MSRLFGIAIELHQPKNIHKILSGFQMFTKNEISISNRSSECFGERYYQKQECGSFHISYRDLEVFPVSIFHFQNETNESFFFEFFDWGNEAKETFEHIQNSGVILMELKKLNPCIKDFYKIEEMIDGNYLDSEIANRFVKTKDYNIIEKYKIHLV
jgi:hypothetical protein